MGRKLAVLLLAPVLAFGGPGIFLAWNSGGPGAGPRAARADAPMGAAWEPGIVAGIERQERERKQRSPEALLRQAKLLAGRRSEGAVEVERLYLLARAYGIAGDDASARSTYEEVLRLAPRLYFAYHDLAMLALRAQPPDERGAERYLKQAIGIHPGYLTGERKLAMLLLRQKRSEDALSYLRRIVDEEPGDLQARFLLAQVLAQAKRLEESEREIDQLLRREPHNGKFALLRAKVLDQQGRIRESLVVYRDLAQRNPGSAEPLLGYLRALDAARRETEGAAIEVEAYMWALEGLLRLERDPERKKDIERSMEEIRQAAAGRKAPGRGSGPPTDAELAEGIPTLEVGKRIAALQYVYVRKTPPTPDLLRVVIGRLSPTAEPDPRARMWALRILGRFGGYGLVGLVRHSLKDPAPDVRPIAVDVLADLAGTNPAARAAAVLALGLSIDAPGELGRAVRAGIQDLVGAVPPPTEDTEIARIRAFVTWWRGPGGAEAQTQALARYPGLADPRPEDVLLPYVRSRDPFVAKAAWGAMSQERRRLLALPELDPGRLDPRSPAGRRRAWLEQMPALGEDVGTAAASSRVAEWVAAFPQ